MWILFGLHLENRATLLFQHLVTCCIKCDYNGLFLKRLDDTKVAHLLGNFWAIWNKSFLRKNLGNIWKKWANFYSSILSHCCLPKLHLAKCRMI